MEKRGALTCPSRRSPNGNGAKRITRATREALVSAVKVAGALPIEYPQRMTVRVDTRRRSMPSFAPCHAVYAWRLRRWTSSSTRRHTGVGSGNAVQHA